MGQAKNRGTKEQRIEQGIIKRQLELEEEERRWQQRQAIKREQEREVGRKIVLAEEHIREHFKDADIHAKFPFLDDDITISKVNNVQCNVYIKSHRKDIVYKVEYDVDGDMKLTNTSGNKERFSVTSLAIMAGVLGGGGPYSL